MYFLHIGKLKERLVWRSEFETVDQAREEIATYIETYHHRPHSGLRYRTPAEVRQTWEDRQRLAVVPEDGGSSGPPWWLGAVKAARAPRRRPGWIWTVTRL
jgi:hypothetical protein